MKRSFTALGVAAALLALGACGSSDNGDTTPTTGPTDVPTSETPGSDGIDGAGELDIWVDEIRLEVLGPVAQSFEEATGVKVNLIEKDFADISDDFITMQPQGEAPDVIVTAHDGLGRLVTNGVLAPIEYEQRHDEFNESAIQAMTYNSRVYGVPYAMENIALLRNDDVTTADIPDTFDELIELSKSLDTQYPVMVQQGEGGDPFHVYPLQSSFGAVVFETDEDGNYTETVGMGGEAGDAFANYLKKLGDENVLNSSNDGNVVNAAFEDGDTAFMIAGPWTISSIREAGVNVSVHPIPSAGGEEARPFVGVQGFFINADAKNPIAANEFVVNYIGSKDVQLALYAAGDRTPALNAAAEEIADDPIAAGFAAAGVNGLPMPAIPAMSSVWEFWGSSQIAIAEGVGEPETIWAQMIANIENAIAG